MVRSRKTSADLFLSTRFVVCFLYMYRTVFIKSVQSWKAALVCVMAVYTESAIIGKCRTFPFNGYSAFFIAVKLRRHCSLSLDLPNRRNLLKFNRHQNFNIKETLLAKLKCTFRLSVSCRLAVKRFKSLSES